MLPSSSQKLKKALPHRLGTGVYFESHTESNEMVFFFYLDSRRTFFCGTFFVVELFLVIQKLKKPFLTEEQVQNEALSAAAE